MRRALSTEWVHTSERATWRGSLDAKSGPMWDIDFARVRLLGALVIHDFRRSYRGQSLGVVWSLLNPLITMTVLSLVFGHIFQVHAANFPVFVLIGTLFWRFTTAAWTSATSSFSQHAALVKQTLFPKALIPIAAVLSRFINMAIEAVVLLVVIAFVPGSVKLTAALLFVPVPLVLLVILVLGVGVMTAVLQPKFRDVGFLVSTIQLLLYWVTPVFYPRTIAPSAIQVALKLNPLTGLLEAIRAATMTGELPAAGPFAITAAECFLILGLGILLYRRHTRSLADFL